jgi:hypothetical protein
MVPVSACNAEEPGSLYAPKNLIGVTLFTFAGYLLVRWRLKVISWRA